MPMNFNRMGGGGGAGGRASGHARRAGRLVGRVAGRRGGGGAFGLKRNRFRCASTGLGRAASSASSSTSGVGASGGFALAPRSLFR